MAVVIGFVVFGVVVAIAAVVVVREAGRIAKAPPPALFDPDDAYDFVVEHLPDDVAATLTPDDVRRILAAQLEFFERGGVSAHTDGATNGAAQPGPLGAGPTVVGGDAEIAFVLDRCAATGEAYLPEQVRGVIDTQLTYLRAIGAIGPVADPSD